MKQPKPGRVLSNVPALLVQCSGQIHAAHMVRIAQTSGNCYCVNSLKPISRKPALCHSQGTVQGCGLLALFLQSGHQHTEGLGGLVPGVPAHELSVPIDLAKNGAGDNAPLSSHLLLALCVEHGRRHSQKETQFPKLGFCKTGNLGTCKPRKWEQQQPDWSLFWPSSCKSVKLPLPMSAWYPWLSGPC